MITPSVRLVRALGDYHLSRRGFLNLREDDILLVVREVRDGWWYGVNEREETGLLPCTYVEPYTLPTPPAELVHEVALMQLAAQLGIDLMTGRTPVLTQRSERRLPRCRSAETAAEDDSSSSVQSQDSEPCVTDGRVADGVNVTRVSSDASRCAEHQPDAGGGSAAAAADRLRLLEGALADRETARASLRCALQQLQLSHHSSTLSSRIGVSDRRAGISEHAEECTRREGKHSVMTAMQSRLDRAIREIEVTRASAVRSGVVLSTKWYTRLYKLLHEERDDRVSSTAVDYTTSDQFFSPAAESSRLAEAHQSTHEDGKQALPVCSCCDDAAITRHALQEKEKDVHAVMAQHHRRLGQLLKLVGARETEYAASRNMLEQRIAIRDARVRDLIRYWQEEADDARREYEERQRSEEATRQRRQQQQCEIAELEQRQAEGKARFVQLMQELEEARRQVDTMQQLMHTLVAATDGA